MRPLGSPESGFESRSWRPSVMCDPGHDDLPLCVIPVMTTFRYVWSRSWRPSAMCDPGHDDLPWCLIPVMTPFRYVCEVLTLIVGWKISRTVRWSIDTDPIVALHAKLSLVKKQACGFTTVKSSHKENPLFLPDNLGIFCFRIFESVIGMHKLTYWAFHSMFFGEGGVLSGPFLGGYSMRAFAMWMNHKVTPKPGIEPKSPDYKPSVLSDMSLVRSTLSHLFTLFALQLRYLCVHKTRKTSTPDKLTSFTW